MQSPRFIRYRDRVIALEHVTHATFTPASSSENERTGEPIPVPCKLAIGLVGGVCFTVSGAEAEDIWKAFRSLALNITRSEEKGAKDANPSD